MKKYVTWRKKEICDLAQKIKYIGGSTDSVLILFLGRFIHGLADSMGVSPAIMFIAGK